MSARIRVIGLAVLAAVLLGAFFAVKGCEGQRDRAVKAEAGQTFAEARSKAAVESQRTVSASAGNEAAVRAAIQEAIHDIRRQDGAADDAGAAGRAGLRGLCGLQHYRDRPGCRLLGADPGGVE